jgi:hypothetical protein
MSPPPNNTTTTTTTTTATTITTTTTTTTQPTLLYLYLRGLGRTYEVTLHRTQESGLGIIFDHSKATDKPGGLIWVDKVMEDSPAGLCK